MDKRILKTKRMLKIAFFELLTEKEFQKITVTDICNRACTSRITFYTHYEDKFDLINDIAEGIKAEIVDLFNKLQNTNNTENDKIKRHYNFIDALMDIEDDYALRLHLDIHALPSEIQLTIYQYVKEISYEIETQYDQINPSYPTQQFSAFLVAGFWAYIGVASDAGISRTQIRKEVKALVKNLLESELFL